MKKLLIAVLLLYPHPVDAQVLVGQSLRLNTGPCTLSSGSGSPEGTRIGKVCDTYLNTVDGVLWEKWSGNGNNSGWGVGHNTNATVNGQLTLTDYITSPAYVSQLSGWRVTGDGAGDFRYLYTDELHAKSFIADLEQALAGSQIIAKSVTTLAVPFTCPVGGGTALLNVDDLPGAPALQVFQLNDFVSIRNFNRSGGSLDITDCVGQVTAPLTPPTGIQQWTFTRALGQDGGQMAAGTTIAARTIVLDYGVPGNGYAETNATDGPFAINAPYTQIVTWQTAPTVNNRTLRTRIGNLRGITGQTEYGALLGTYGGSTARYLLASNLTFETHNLDISMFNSGVETIRLDHAVPSLSIGNAIPTGFTAGTGVWMGRDVADGVYKFRVGNPLGNRIQWNGTTMQFYGDGGGVTNISGQNIQTGTVSADRLTVGSGTNVIRNSDCRVSTDEWGNFGNSGYAINQGFNFPTWNLNNESATCYMSITAGVPASGSISGIYTTPTYPVIAGNRYEASIYLGVHRSGPTLGYIQWFNNVGAFVGQTNGSTCTTAFPGGTMLASYCRSVAIGNAPPSSAQARLVVQTTHTGESDPFVFYVHAFFGEGTANQTEATPWGPAGITEIIGGMIRTGAITANKIQVDQLSAISANLGVVNVGILNGVVLNGITINGVEVNAGTINAPNINGGNISGVNITGVNITGTSTITGSSISGGSVSGTTVTGSSFLGGTISIGSGGVFNGLQVDSNGVVSASLIYTGQINISGAGAINIGAYSGGGARVICVNNNGDVYPSSNGAGCAP